MLKKIIQEDLKEALKESRELEVSVLRMLMAAFLNKEKEKRYKISKEKTELTEEQLGVVSQLTEEELLQVLSSEVKKRRDSILMFERGKRDDLVEKEKKELAVLQKYLNKSDDRN